jgi:hypothetical protein
MYKDTRLLVCVTGETIFENDGRLEAHFLPLRGF